jgi:hypothetical protein
MCVRAWRLWLQEDTPLARLLKPFFMGDDNHYRDQVNGPSPFFDTLGFQAHEPMCLCIGSV